MNIKFKKLMSVLLCCVMLFGMLPVNAFANVTGEQSGIVLEENIPEAPVDEVIPSSDEPVIPPVEEPLVEEPPVEEPPVVPVEDEPVMEEEVPEEEVTSRFEEFKVQIEELQSQAKELDQNSDSFEAESEVLLEKADAFDNAVSTAYEDGILSEDEYNALSQMSADFYQIVFADENDNQVEDATVYYDLLQKYYRGTSKVYWDVMETHEQGGNQKRIASVTLGGKDVVRAESDSTNWRGGNALSTYYPNATKDSGETKTLKITPVEGYYVTEVVVACSIGQTPYDCKTWGDDSAFKKTFSLTADGFAECDLHSRYFGHESGQFFTPTYFILIKTAPLPSPMYIEYDCGEMATILGSEYAGSIFQDPDGWTAESEDNYLGSNGVMDTDDTQYEYKRLPDDESNVTRWKHYANTVTAAAKLAAAEKGYYFAGWAATYYNNCTDSGTPDGAGNNSTYVFSNKYSNNAVIYDEGAPVALTTHVQLVAQWEPVKLTVQKVVNGAPTTQKYNISVLREDGSTFQSVTFNGAGSEEYAPVVAGTYSVTEEGANKSVEVNGKKYTLTTTYSTPVRVTTEAIAAGIQENVTLTVTNTYSEVTTMDIPVTKKWDDADNQDGKRPGFVTVNLLADGVETGDIMVLSDSNNWSGTFRDLEQFGENGAILYSVTEAEVVNYTPSIDGTQEAGFVITNKHTPEQIRVIITKEWNDANNQDGKRPTSITAVLYANDVKHSDLTITAEENWTKTIDNLPKYAAGKKIEYTVKEINVPDGYTASANGLTITNSYQPAVVSVSGTKTWNDNNDQDGIRPDSIIVNLLADGVDVKGKSVTVTPDENGEWHWTFENLPKYKAGKEIVYTVSEGKVEGYTSDSNGMDIINTHTPETIDIPVSKVWADANNQDGKRSAAVTITLKVNDEVVKSLELSESNGWADTFENLPKFKDGVVIEYTVEEPNVPEGYTPEVKQTDNGVVITNTHIPATIEIPVTKTWDDNDNQDGLRPESITVNLLANGVEVASKTVTEDDGWAWTFENLPEYATGQKIVYTISEINVDGYVTEIDGYNITNTHTPATIEIPVSKTWVDNNNQDGIRPESITAILNANGKEAKRLVLNETNGWFGKFENLPKFENGKEIKYTVEESGVPEGYESEIGETDNGIVITNTHAPEKISVAVTKEWDDAENQDGIRPSSVTINLMDGENVAGTVVLNAENKWTHVFADLDKFAAGQEIVYTVQETEIPDGYEAAVTGDMTEGYTVTNTHAPEKTSVAVSKVWDDANDQDGKRPAAVTIRLLANGETTDVSLSLNDSNEWKGTFTDLDKFADGKEIEYTVSEDTVAEYKDPAITGSAADGYIVTNTHVPETVEVSGKKTWADADNQDGKRPEEITINLLADNVAVEGKSVTVTADENGEWQWTFENLPKYKDGTEIVYAITENAVQDYSTTYNGYDVINSYTPEQTSVTVTKVWKDAGNQDGIRPNDIKITLLADGVDTGKTLTLNSGNNWTGSFTELDVYKAGEVIAYTVQEQAVPGYTTKTTGTAADGFVVTNTHTPEVITVEGSKTWNDADDHDGFRPDSITINLLANGEKIATKTVKEADGWKWSFENLPKYKAGEEGVLAEYTIFEDNVDKYTPSINGYDVTNSYTPQKTAVAVNKVWLDENDQDGIRPNHITVKLLAGNEDTGKTLVLSVGNNWSSSFTDLDKYKGGKEIVYTIAEVEVPEGYTSEISGSAAEGFTVTNTHTPAVVSVSGTKTWEDDNNRDGKRPASITIRLLADGKEIKVIEVNEAAEWKWSIENLPKFAAGKEIVYTITEDAVDGYTPEIKNFNVTNTHNPAKTTVTVTKVWEDSNDQDGLRPKSVTINLLANGEKVKSHKIKEDDKWTYTFEKLDKFEDGKEIVYTVTEEAVEGYNTVITGNAAKGFTVTNSHTPEVINIAGTKTWDDGNNQDGKRPDVITVNLLANGKVIDTVKVTSADKWTYLFTNLPKFEAGEEIIYTVTEDAVEDYTTTYDGYNIINKYSPKKTSITVTKRWVDGHNHDGIRPNSVKVILYANGKPVDTMRLSEKHNWTGVFKNLPVYQNGEPIKYTLQEKSVSGYNATITGNARKGFIVTNTHNIIPKTGDESNLPLYTGLFGAGFSAMAVLLFLAKPRKKGKYAR